MLLASIAALVGSALAAPPVLQLYCYDKTHTLIQTQPFINFTQNTDAYFYRVGRGSRVIKVWQPFDGQQELPLHVTRNLLNVGSQLILSTLDSSDAETVSVEVKNAGWGGVSSDAVCVDGPELCADVIIMGTTQVAARVANNDLISLNTYFNTYAEQTGQAFSEGFLQKYFFDYYYEKGWMAIPYVTDVRVVFFNRTTFDTLNLKYPPPWGDWGIDYTTTWTWKAFQETTKAIKDSGIGYGFNWFSAWDEDIKLVTLIARDYSAQLLTTNGTCGFRSEGFRTALREVIRPLWRAGGSATPAFIDLADAAVASWIASDTLLAPLDSPSLCCKWWSPDRMFGMDINIPSTLYTPGTPWHPTADPTGTIGMAYMPGKASFLGGSGLTITSKSKYPDLAWQYLQLSTGAVNSADVNLKMGLLSPYYEAVAKTPAWASPRFDVVKAQFQKAVPLQYPQGSFPQFGDLEGRKPGRLLLAELAFKNIQDDQLIDRFCTAVDYIMLKPCTAANLKFKKEPCDPATFTQAYSYEFIDASACRGGISLYNSTITQCPHIPIKSGMAIGITVVTALCVVFFVILLGLTFYYRATQPFKNSSPNFIYLSLVGCILCCVSIFLMPGDPLQKTCGVEFWLLAIGFGLAVGSLIMKINRVALLFGKDVYKIKAKNLKDSVFLTYLAFLIVVEVGFLLVFNFYDNPHVVYTSKTLDVSFLPYMQPACGTSQTMGSVLLIVFNVALILYMLKLAWQVRNVPTRFNEGKLLVVSAFLT